MVAKINKIRHALWLRIMAGWHFTSTFLLCLLFLAPLISCTTIQPVITEADSQEYRAAIREGWAHLNKRHHSLAVKKFSEAERLKPSAAEPGSGRARALFYMDRFAQALQECADLPGKSADYINALGFCWGARLEIGRASATIKEEIQGEIDKFLLLADPSLELLYSIYDGYYYLKKEEERLAIVMRLAQQGAASELSEDIAAVIFGEIVTAEKGSEMRAELAELYLRYFPTGEMVDQVALLVLQERLKKQGDRSDYWQVARTVLAGQDSPQLNSAVAFWLLNHGTGYEQIIKLISKNIRDLADPGPTATGEEDRSFREKETDQKSLFYKYLLSRAWLGKGEFAKARQLLDDILVKEQNWPELYHFRGMVALGEGNEEKAIDYFSTALAKGSGIPATSSKLRILLAAHYGFTGEPLAFIRGRHRGVIFSDATRDAGLEGVKASRVAWGDYDNDGDEDLLLDGNRLYNNQGNGIFVGTELLISAGITATNGGVWGDYDNDHFLDIFTTSSGQNYLLHNEAGTGFTKTDLIPMEEGRPGRTEAAAWGDLNNDGYLDLYVANYEDGAVMRGQCGKDRLLINQGGVGFLDNGTALGVVSEESMCGRGVSWSDLNGDGWQDIMVSNYRLDPNFLWLNQGDGLFVDVAELAGVQGHEVNGAYGHSIGSVSGDLDGDGDLDLFTSNLAHPRSLEYSDQSMVLLNNGARLMKFTNRFTESGIAFDETSSDPLLFDADLDGDLDLYVTSVYSNRSSHLYINDGKGRFSERTRLSGAGVLNGWGVASADYDGDGYPDLLVASPDGVHLLHNEGGRSNWLAIRLEDQNCNRFGVGSRVIITYGDKSQVREIVAGRGTGSQDSLVVHFGLGDYLGPVALEIKTLCGDTIQNNIQETALNRILVIKNSPPNNPT